LCSPAKSWATGRFEGNKNSPNRGQIAVVCHEMAIRENAPRVTKKHSTNSCGTKQRRELIIRCNRVLLSSPCQDLKLKTNCRLTIGVRCSEPVIFNDRNTVNLRRVSAPSREGESEEKTKEFWRRV
jgi:hypothetical protein